MTCREVRDYLFAFLDNELEAAMSLAVQRHLEACCDCGREAETERAVRRSMGGAVERQLAEIPSFDEARLLKATRVQKPANTPAGIPWLKGWTHWVYGVGQALVLLAGLAAGVRFSSGRGRRPGPSFADVLVTDHKNVAAGGEPVQVASGDPARVSSWIRERHDWDVQIPSPAGDRHKLLGARTCSIFGRPAAQALYEVDGTPASLVILPNESADLRDMGASSGAGLLSQHFRGHTIVARQCGAFTYAAVGQGSEEQLTGLIPNSREQREA